MAQNRNMASAWKIAVLTTALCICASASAQFVVTPEPVSNGMSLSGLRLRIRSAQAKEAIRLKVDPIRSGGTLEGFRFTFTNTKSREIAIYPPELGWTLRMEVSGTNRNSYSRPLRALN